MTCALLLTALLSSVALPAVQASEATPITKVIQLLADLESKIIGEGEAAQKTYEYGCQADPNCSRRAIVGKSHVKPLTLHLENEYNHRNVALVLLCLGHPP